MKKNTIKRLIILTVVFIYPFLSLYSSKIETLVGIPWFAIQLILFLLAISYNIEDIQIFIINKKPYYYLVVIILVISLLWTTEYTRGIAYIAVLSITPLFGLSIYKLEITKQVWRNFSYSTIIFSIMLQTGLLLQGYNYYDFGGSRFGHIQGSEVALDPNWLGAWLAVSSIYFFLKWRNEKPFFDNKATKLSKAINIVLCIIGLYFSLKTGSLSANLGLLAGFMAYTTFNRNRVARVFTVFIISLITLSSLIPIKGDLTVRTRLSNIDIKNNERLKLVQSSIESLKGNPSKLFGGYGVGGGDKAVGEHYIGAHIQEDGIARYNNHNTYLDLILQLGVIGLLIVILIVSWALKTMILSMRLKNNSFVFLFSFILTQALFYNPIKNGFYIISFGIATSLYLSNDKIKEEVRNGEIIYS